MDDEVFTYCGRCGEPELSAHGPEGDHSACLGALALEPPRYCARCRRRMVVQVTPTGWTASCSRHGELGARTSGKTPA